MSGPIRRNFAHLSAAEQQAYVDAVLQADLTTFLDGVSYWDKQDQIHEATHNHGGNSFLPWHRELVNRYEALLQQADPDVALHYWDWTEDPRAASDGQGGTVALLSAALLGRADGMLDGPLAALHNGGVLAGSRDQTGSFTDPPMEVVRLCQAGAPAVQPDADILTSTDGTPQAQQWTVFRTAVEASHNTTHGFFGSGSTIQDSHRAFEDPFVFLLHSNVDRLFAMWQAQPGEEWRLDPDLVYGDQSETTGPESIRATLQPWDGTVEFGAPIEPWVGASSAVVVKDCRDPSVVRPPAYDTLPTSVEQVAPLPGDQLRFVGVVEHLPTARAVRLRVRSVASIAVDATVTGPFTILDTPVTSPEPQGYEERDVLVWVLFTPGAAGTAAAGTATLTASTGEVFVVDITATVVPNPTVGTSLVLDRSGSVSLPSGLPLKSRMDVLHDSAPLFVALLDATDGVGVVRFDVDASPATPVAPAGPMIGGAGRLLAADAITDTVVTPGGLTAIGDGLELAAAQLAAVTGQYDSTATIVFTDGHETADKTIAAAASSVHSRVFGIGLGTPEQLNPIALSDLADGTGGYVMLTGNPGVHDQLLLQKYFAQVLAGATNAAVVVDPDGFVPVGGRSVEPFRLTSADIRTDVLLLGEMVGVIDVEVVAPDGTSVTAGAGAEEAVGDAYRALRVVPADVLVPPTAQGRWQVVLTVDRGRLKRWLTDLRHRLDALEDRELAAQVLRLVTLAIDTHGVPYTLSVQARSALNLGVAVSQASRLPGSSGLVRATLTDSGVPLRHSVSVRAHVTPPAGAPWEQAMPSTGPGAFTTSVATTTSGVYRVLVRASGADLRGDRFTREELRTLAVWARGDDTPPVVIDPGAGGTTTHLDTCGLLLCLLADEGVRALLERHGVDAGGLARCVKRACR
ncbi:tyrosinase family protein [Cellulomonas cellasea]|uniref:VWFA domain-containing protein n=2 Tax=Cellulomonas cellasea TaxID=43670 RepID=A0A0A0B9F3_9CELL|nr:tyrosinase family protein [Cellulomonas cellasea]KGM02434.1 hypothetical protein Q760_13420 [Cellulomonas cellasea DSM 20118]GEA87702.1 hypothetical protein CCE01nite_16510 [Cellulomonas cellasea]